MIATLRYLILLGCIFMAPALYSQGLSTTDTLKIPANWKPEFRRQLIHDAINKEQKAVMVSDGKADLNFSPSSNEEINFLLTYTLIRKVDNIQYMIETNKALDHRLKVNYLKGLENILKYYKDNWRKRTEKWVNPMELPGFLGAYVESIEKDRKGESIETIIQNLSYDAGTAVLQANIFDKNPGYRVSRNLLVRKYSHMHPEKTFYTLKNNPDVPFADSLVRVVAKKYPRQLYDYAAAGNKLGAIIRNIKDDIFISTVSEMAKSKSGQQYFPFLDNIVKGKMTIADIDLVKDDELLYYRLLVKTQMEYVTRALNRDTAFEFKSLTKKLETKAKEVFVNTINALHNEGAEVRFRIIQPLTSEELYYLAVSSDGLIYTSSYVNGVYPLMMKKFNNRGDSLLKILNFDRYRKFIKMAAAYNTLSNFLSSFPDAGDANNLMRAFVGKLEKSEGLEDGVDVADSYASIAEAIKPMANEMLNNVQANYQRTISQNNKRGMAIYNILDKLFLSADSSKRIDLTKELGIPPVYEVPYKVLANDSGRVIIQVFMYGDKDGIGVFPGILNLFNNSNWITDRSKPEWVIISSVKGKPVSIFLNRPLPEEKNEDAKAQEALGKYLENNRLYPTVTINRGHSYNAPYTIEQMSPASKIVFMGSCGGYRLIHDILEKASDAHIVGTKQIADVPVNNPFLKLLAEKLRSGSNIEWIPFWKELDKMVTNEIFDDYVPPYKNLGALFIKAYKIAMKENEDPI